MKGLKFKMACESLDMQTNNIGSYIYNTQVKQGRKHSPSVADGWAGAEILKIKNVADQPIDWPTHTASSRVVGPQLINQ